jgi:hypothetical protein
LSCALWATRLFLKYHYSWLSWSLRQLLLSTLYLEQLSRMRLSRHQPTDIPSEPHRPSYKNFIDLKIIGFWVPASLQSFPNWSPRPSFSNSWVHHFEFRVQSPQWSVFLISSSPNEILHWPRCFSWQWISSRSGHTTSMPLTFHHSRRRYTFNFNRWVSFSLSSALFHMSCSWIFLVRLYWTYDHSIVLMGLYSWELHTDINSECTSHTP